MCRRNQLLITSLWKPGNRVKPQHCYLFGVFQQSVILRNAKFASIHQLIGTNASTDEAIVENDIFGLFVACCLKHTVVLSTYYRTMVSIAHMDRNDQLKSFRRSLPGEGNQVCNASATRASQYKVELAVQPVYEQNRRILCPDFEDTFVSVNSSGEHALVTQAQNKTSVPRSLIQDISRAEATLELEQSRFQEKCPLDSLGQHHDVTRGPQSPLMIQRMTLRAE